jgi:hypothetical protein
MIRLWARQQAVGVRYPAGTYFRTLYGAYQVSYEIRTWGCFPEVTEPET